MQLVEVGATDRGSFQRQGWAGNRFEVVVDQQNAAPLTAQKWRSGILAEHQSAEIGKRPVRT